MSAPRPPGSGAHLVARSVGVQIDGAEILGGVDLEVRAGEVVALVGPNGAGKSTLLSALAGDVVPTTGTVELDGRPVRDWAVRALARERAVLLQKQGLAFGFHVEDVVRMGRAPWHRTPRQEADDEVVTAALLRADIATLAERLFPTLSGGEQARASFARILAQETPVLLLDEPTAALDIRHQEALLTACRDLADTGCAVVVVLHDLTLAAAYAHRVCLLASGRVRADGPPATVLTATLLSDVYEHPVEVLDHPNGPVVVPVRHGHLSAARRSLQAEEVS